MPLRSAATAEPTSMIAFTVGRYLYRWTCFPLRGSETAKKMQIKAWWGTQTSVTEEQEAVRRLKVFAGILNTNSPLRPASICSALINFSVFWLVLGERKDPANITGRIIAFAFLFCACSSFIISSQLKHNWSWWCSFSRPQRCLPAHHMASYFLLLSL